MFFIFKSFCTVNLKKCCFVIKYSKGNKLTLLMFSYQMLNVFVPSNILAKMLFNCSTFKRSSTVVHLLCSTLISVLVLKIFPLC